MVFQLAMLAVDDVFPNKDPLYISWMWRNMLEAWNLVMIHSQEAVGILALVCLLLCVLLFSKHSIVAVATPMVTLGARVRALPGIRCIYKLLGERAMRKEVYEAQSDEWVDEIIEIGESKVAAGLMTNTQAKEWYATFSRSLPILRFAATHDDTAGDLKAAIQERRLNEHRDVNGAIVPVPVP